MRLARTAACCRRLLPPPVAAAYRTRNELQRRPSPVTAAIFLGSAISVGSLQPTIEVRPDLIAANVLNWQR